MIRHYRDLSRLLTFEEKYHYLRLTGKVGESTFGADRYLNQMLYTSPRWRRLRDEIIIRDDGCDLGDPQYEIGDRILVHHMNAITADDIENETPFVFDPDFLICTSPSTHLAIHFGNEKLLPQLPITRFSGDTCLWKPIRQNGRR